MVIGKALAVKLVVSVYVELSRLGGLTEKNCGPWPHCHWYRDAPGRIGASS
jgi:hypothetical protein